jgi:CBS-domain-containing membrane protein
MRMTTYKTLTLNNPQSSYLLKQTDSSIPSIKHGSPALALMTDFQGKPPITVSATTSIDAALEHMIDAGVRLLFVINADNILLGTITSYDIQGEKPMLYMQSQDCRIGICSRTDIEAQDIMTPVEKWKTVRYDNLADATLNDIANTFLSLGQHHIIVIEPLSDQDTAIVRGVFSLTDLERALDTSLTINEMAESFSDIERALNK